MPLDDAYIHFQYARSIATGQPYAYNPGLPPTSGATSFLYPYLLALGYLIAQSIVPVLPGFFMTWADYPIYSTYELAPRVIADFDAVIDQQTAAAVLQVGGMVLLWVQIAYRFLSWGYAQVNDDDRRSGRLHGAGTS